MSLLVHRPAGSGHPYRVDPDQRFPVQLVAGERFELRATASPSVAAVAVEFADGAVHPLTAVTMDELYSVPPTDGGEGHLDAASGSRPDVGDRSVFVWRGVVPSGRGTLRYRFVADGTPSEWFDAPVGSWRPAPPDLLRFFSPDSAQTGASGRKEPEWAEVLLTGDGPVRVRFALDLAPGQRVAGFGERFDRLDQRGHRLDATVFEQYKNQGNRTYLPSPFAVIGGGDEPSWGFHVDTSRRVWFDVGASDPDRLTVELDLDPDDPQVRVVCYFGTAAHVVAAHVAATGGLARPPDWVFTPWMSANNWNTQARVLEVVERSIELGVPTGVMVVEAWSDESTFCVFRDAQYGVRPDGGALTLADIAHPADGAWPDPVGLTKRLHDLGVKLVLWQIPIVPTDRDQDGQVAADAATMIELGYCVAEADGTPYRNRGWWFPGGLLPDWTNAEAREWWLAKRRYLLDEVGVDGFKTDGGEHLWGDDLRFANGERGAVENNRYPVRYAEAYHELFARAGVDGTTFSRAGFTGAGRAPCHWAGDENSTWEAFRASIVAGLTAGLSGVAFWGWDLAGFSGPLPSVELYVRSAAMASLCPIMQYHAEFDAGDVAIGGESSGDADPVTAERPTRRDRTPWNVAEQHGDERALTLYRHFALLRERLLPYLREQADTSVATGLPMMRAMCLEDSRDDRLWDAPFQYLLGEDLLVAPVCHEAATTVDVVLPAGRWVDAWTGVGIDGPTTITREVPWHEIAVYVRGGRPDVLAAFTPFATGVA